MKTYALVCAFNEEKTIKEVILKTLKFVDGLIAVNDGSTDRTFSVLSSIKNRKLTVISYNTNRGKGYAIRKGFEKFLGTKGDVLVTLDADLQHDPKEIRLVINPVRDGVADVIIGSRYTKTMPRLKVFLNVLANLNLLAASGTFFSDVSSGFRAYSRSAVSKILPSLTLDRFGIELEILKVCADRGIKVGIMPVSCSYTTGKKANLWKLFHGHFTFAWKYKRDMLHKLAGV